MTLKSTDEIRELLSNAKLDFVSVMNKALNDYLPRFFIAAHLQMRFAQQNNAKNVQSTKKLNK
jgi:hypothetical protein